MGTSVFIATSLDGFIAREDGDIDWLNDANKTIPSGEDCGFVDFMNSIDCLIMGRNSFEKVLSLGQWNYDKPVIVLTKMGIDIPVELADKVSTSGEAPHKLLCRLRDEGKRNFYIDGGLTVHSFLVEDLIDELTITIVPVLIGRGKRLFGNLERDICLKHVYTKAYDFGFVQSKYLVERSCDDDDN